jgi:hypothetical protein
LTVLVVSILITRAARRKLYDFINLTIFSFLIRVSNSSWWNNHEQNWNNNEEKQHFFSQLLIQFLFIPSSEKCNIHNLFGLQAKYDLPNIFFLPVSICEPYVINKLYHCS